jgi:putative acetyltransferase
MAACLDAPHTEQLIVKALRNSGALRVSLTAEDATQIIGQLALSPVTISDASIDWYGLGPISVTPIEQGKSIGSKLLHAALAALRNLKAVLLKSGSVY